MSGASLMQALARRLPAGGPFRALGHRPFAWLWAGQSVSFIGDSLYRIALAWWVLEETGSAAAMGTVLIFSFTPMLIFLLLGGVAVDRFSRLRLMLVSDLARGVITAVVAALAFAGRLEIWHVYGASILFGFVDAFFQPAYQAAIPEITPGEKLTSANALTRLSMQLVGIIGPGLGAAAVKLAGPPSAFALDSITFFISAICVFHIRHHLGAPQAAQDRQGVLKDMRIGLRAVAASPWLWITIAIFSLVNITEASPRNVALPFLVKETLGAEVDALGLIYSASAAGALLSTLWLGRAARLRRRGVMAYGSFFLTGLSSLALGLPIGLVGYMTAAFVGGASGSIFGLIWINTLQEMVPRELFGRVISIDMLGSYVLLPVGFGLAGQATDLLGAPTVFLIGGSLTMLLMVAGLLHPAVRGLD
jgi:DHA3 family tetracycline resistance protein-like MFS transporter